MSRLALATDARPGAGSLTARILLCVPMAVAAVAIPSIVRSVAGTERQHASVDWIARFEIALLAIVVLGTLVLLPCGWIARRRGAAGALRWVQRVVAVLQLLLGALCLFVLGVSIAAAPGQIGVWSVAALPAVAVPFATAWLLWRDSVASRPEVASTG